MWVGICNRFNRFILATLVAVLLAACNTPAITSSDRQDKSVKSYQLPPGSGMIHIYKTTSLPIGGFDRIHLNGKFLGEINENTFLAVLVDPGNYQVSRRSDSLTRYPAEYSFDVKAGEKVYLARDFGTRNVHHFRMEDPTLGHKQIEVRRLSLFDDHSFRFALARQPIVHVTPQTQPQNRFPEKALGLKYRAGVSHPDDIAVIIGNANYAKLGKDIPDVTPAYADAESFEHYAISALGIRPGNIINLRDATSAQMERVFGSERTHEGQLFNWVRPGVSNVHVYYSGHGAPGSADGTAYLVPADSDATAIEINGYPLSMLYQNLDKLPARTVSVVLEACFSGNSQGGSVIPRASGIHIRPKAPIIPDSVTVISAGGSDQIASWEKDSSYSLFTKYYLTAMSGEADKGPHGNEDGKVSLNELGTYLNSTLTYFARRYYGRNQKAWVSSGNAN